MAIEGPLRELALSDVLQLLALSRKTGVLIVRRDGLEQPARIHLDQGAVVGGSAYTHTRRLGELLLLAGKVTAAQLEQAAAEQRRQPGRRLGAILAHSHGVPADEVRRQLRFQVEELIYDLVRWTDGEFRFEEAPPLDPGPISIRLATESLLMEAARQMDEWSALTDGAPDVDLVPRLAEGPGVSGMLDLQPVEWEVLAAIDGERTLRGIAREVGRGEFEVAKAVFSLVSMHVVEVGKRRSAPPAGAPPRVSSAVEPVERALSEGRLDEAERTLSSLLARHPESSELLLLRGRLEGARSRWAEAVRWLERSVERDPLLGPAYLHLGQAAVRVGALERAEEALRTYLRLPESGGNQRANAERAVHALRELRQVLEEVA